MTVLLNSLEKLLVRRIQIIMMILAGDLDENRLVARSEEGYDHAGELRFRDGNFTWKVGRRNGMQDIYFVLEYMPNLEDPKTIVTLYHSLQRLKPETRRSRDIDSAIPILTGGLVRRYPVLYGPVEELLTLVR